MSGRRYRQKFCDALDNAEDDRVEKAHAIIVTSAKKKLLKCQEYKHRTNADKHGNELEHRMPNHFGFMELRNKITKRNINESSGGNRNEPAGPNCGRAAEEEREKSSHYREKRREEIEPERFSG